MPIGRFAIHTEKRGHAKARRVVIVRAVAVRFPTDANLRIPVSQWAPVREDVFPHHESAPREVPCVREARGAADLGRRRRAFQRLRFLRNRLQTGGREDGQGRETREGRDACRREAEKERLQLRQVTAHETIRTALAQAASRLGASDVEVALERPRDPTHGDIATNLALTLAKQLGQKPRAVADQLIAGLELPAGLVRKTEIAGPGFINFFLADAQVVSALPAILAAGPDYGKSDVGHSAPINVEFVSANPTGPLHVGHGRQAALGDAIAALLEWTGWRVSREFYYNDARVQIVNLAASVQARIR